MNTSVAFTIHSEENGAVINCIRIRWEELCEDSMEIINATIGKSLRCWQGTARQERLVRISKSETSCTYYHVIESYNNDVVGYDCADSKNQEEVLIFDLPNKRLKRVRLNLKNSQYIKRRNTYGYKNNHCRI